MIDLFDSFGRKIELGKKIASGGEGVVYEVPSLGNNIYNATSRFGNIDR
jgi:DNA-binding helix-hairpin-helix protein with protein kinase domain